MDKDKNLIEQLLEENDGDISESVEYLKHVFGSVMDVIFGDEHGHDDKNNKCCRKLV